jgi:hypothetical protein
MSIYKKLFDAKKEIGKISKDSENPFFKSNYLSLNGLIDAIEEVLNKNELLLLQPIEAEWVKSKIIDIEDGEFVSSEMHLPNITDPQKLGSAITYFRRYTLESLLGLKAEDDDANLANKPTTQAKDEALVKWLNDKQSQTVINNGLDKIKECLAYYDGKTVRDDGFKYCISKKLKLVLETALKV